MHTGESASKSKLNSKIVISLKIMEVENLVTQLPLIGIRLICGSPSSKSHSNDATKVENVASDLYQTTVNSI